LARASKARETLVFLLSKKGIHSSRAALEEALSFGLVIVFEFDFVVDEPRVVVLIDRKLATFIRDVDTLGRERSFDLEGGDIDIEHREEALDVAFWEDAVVFEIDLNLSLVQTQFFSKSPWDNGVFRVIS
jgi:hypothetical protein